MTKEDRYYKTLSKYIDNEEKCKNLAKNIVDDEDLKEWCLEYEKTEVKYMRNYIADLSVYLNSYTGEINDKYQVKASEFEDLFSKLKYKMFDILMAIDDSFNPDAIRVPLLSFMDNLWNSDKDRWLFDYLDLFNETILFLEDLKIETIISLQLKAIKKYEYHYKKNTKEFLYEGSKDYFDQKYGVSKYFSMLNELRSNLDDIDKNRKSIKISKKIILFYNVKKENNGLSAHDNSVYFQTILSIARNYQILNKLQKSFDYYQKYFEIYNDNIEKNYYPLIDGLLAYNDMEWFMVPFVEYYIMAIKLNLDRTDLNKQKEFFVNYFKQNSASNSTDVIDEDFELCEEKVEEVNSYVAYIKKERNKGYFEKLKEINKGYFESYQKFSPDNSGIVDQYKVFVDLFVEANFDIEVYEFYNHY